MPRKSKDSDTLPSAERYRMVENLLDKGVRSSDIARVLEQRYQISRRQAERDIQRVKENRSLLFTGVVSGHTVQNYHRCEHLYQECLKKGDHQTALKVMAMQEKLVQQSGLFKTGGTAYALSDSTGIPEHELEALLAAFGEDRLAE
jgi:hypothetical protein